jgi:hypothetical protein
MKTQTQFDIDLTVRSFAYVAEQLTRSPAVLAPSAQYEQILSEAEKHRSALRLVRRDTFEMVEEAFRNQTMTKSQFHQSRKAAERAIEQAQEAITHIAAQYAPHKSRRNYRDNVAQLLSYEQPRVQIKQVIESLFDTSTAAHS